MHSMTLTPQDILYLALAVSVLTFTGFICWLVYYAGRILKNTNSMIEEVHERLSSILSTLTDMGSKIESVYRIVNSFGGGVGDFLKKTVRRKADSWLGGDTKSGDEDDEEMSSSTEKIVAAALEKDAKSRSKIQKKR